MKRKLISIFCVLILTLTSAGLMAGCQSQDENVVRVNEVTHSIFYAPFYAAISLGYFEEEGITIDLTNGGGSDKSMTAVISGQADIGLMGPETGVYVCNEGREDHAIIIGQLTKRDGSFLLGKTKDDNFTWDKLKGTSIIGGRKGGMPQMTLEYVRTRKQALRERSCRAFLLPGKRGAACQRNQSAPAPTPAAPTSRMGSTVRSMKLPPADSTTGTDVPPTATRSTAELGNESATAMLRRILCVRCV